MDADIVNICCTVRSCTNPAIGQCRGNKGNCNKYYCVNHSVGKLCSDCALQEFMQLRDNMKAYLRERGVEHELKKDEVPFAVLWPTRAADAKSLRELGEQLRAWMMNTPGVNRILGLERLLEGECPEVSVELLGIPYNPMRPESWIERVALVVIENEVSTATIATNLGDVVERSGIAKVTSLEQYSWMNR